MATITSAQSGNFTATTTWVGGVVPGPADIAVATTGHVVVIDQDITVTQLRNNNTTGYFELGNGRTINGTVRATGGNTDWRVVLFTATTSATINGDLIGGTDFTFNQYSAVRMTGSGTLYVNGNLYGGTVGSRQSYAVDVAGTGCVLQVTGNVFGASGVGGSSYTIRHRAGTVNIVGNVYADTLTTIFCESTAGTVNVTGNVYGTSLATNIRTIYQQSTVGDVDVVGAVYAGTQLGSNGIRLDSTLRDVRVTGNLIDSAATSAVWAPHLIVANGVGSTTRYRDSLGNEVIRASLDIAGDHPLPADVRDGTEYAYGQFTGTLAVPPTASVAAGVPVDNTIGTAALAPADVAALVGAQIAAALDSVP